MLRGLLPPRHTMRIMTRLARQPPGALGKTPRLPQPVHRPHRLKLPLMPRARCVIKRQLKIPQRLTRPVRKRSPVEAHQCRRNSRAAGLQMALHTNFHGALRAQPRRVHNGRTNVPHLRPRRANHPQMRRPWPVAPLTINPLRQGSCIHRITVRPRIRRRNPRHTVVAKHAFIRNKAPR